jgi:hypothetical protein
MMDISLRTARARLEQISDFLDRSETPAAISALGIQKFIEKLTIVDRNGRLSPLIMNRSQEMVLEKLMECREAGRPARFICLKARQIGISTLIEAFTFALVAMYPHRSSLVVAHSIESAQTIFAMAGRFHRYLPRDFQRPLVRNNSRRIQFAAPHSSFIQIDTAANRHLGRGGTFQYVHASETAFWEHPEEPVLAINQSVPNHWDTMIFWESTANGAQNLFHRTWIAAERGENDMEPIFLPWKSFSEYFLPVARGENLGLSKEEEAYRNDEGLSDEQIKWAVHARRNRCHDSWEKFHQEYPASPRLAFVFTGMPWFDPVALRRTIENAVRPPLECGRLDIPESRFGVPLFVSDPSGPLKIWQRPENGLAYSLGMDVGEGVGADYTVIQVICNDTGEVAATYRSNRVGAEIAGLDAYTLGKFYNSGLLGIERNGPGLAALVVCERGLAGFDMTAPYPNLYYHTVTDRRDPEETRRLGWITNTETKAAMLQRLANAFSANALTIYSRNLALEMQGLVWDAEKHRFRQNYRSPGSRLSHDDEIMALAIANEMRLYNFSARFFSCRLQESGLF